MGLDTTHDCWHGAYSAFHRWRTEIARVAGQPVEPNDGIAGHPDYVLDWEAFDALGVDYIMGEWGDHRPEDPLVVLLAHSDCEGILPAWALEPLAVRLEGLLPKLHGDGGGHIGDYRAKTQQFINGLREAAEAGEAVGFH